MVSMTIEQVRAFFAEKMAASRDRFISDLEAMSHEALCSSGGGQSRCPYDYTFECAFVNRRIAARIRGEEPEKIDFEGWMKAPDEFKNKELAVQTMRGSCETVMEAWNQMPIERMDAEIQLPNDTTTPIELMYIAIWHTGYHDGQLTLMQAIQGDAENHWM